MPADNINDLIARGVTPADWASVPGAFWAGQERGLFAGGLPKDAQGNVDYRQMAEMLARVQGAGAIPALTALRNADIQQQAITGLDRAAPSIFGPVTPQPQSQPQERPPPVPSIQRTGGLPVEGGGEPKPAGSNLVQPSEVPGSARMSVDGGPEQPLSDAGYPPGFRAFNQAPVTGPPTAAFTPERQQVAQAQPRQQQAAPPPPPQQGPVPPGSPGFFSEQNAAAYEQAAQRANFMATRVGFGGQAISPAAARLGQQAQQYSDTAKQIRDQMAKISEEREKSRLKVQGAVPEKLAEHSVAQIADTYKKAQTFAEGVPATQNLLDQINSKSGIFSGKWATQRLAWAKIGEIVGVPDDRVMPTEAYQSLVGRKVAATVKSFGSGTSITNQDREYASNMEGGNINLDESSMRRILTLSDQVARDQIKNHNRDVDRLQKVYPDAPLGNFKVEEPPKLSGRTTQPKAAPPGVIPPAPGPQDRQSGQTYMTPKGPAFWRGTGWELVK